MGDKDINAILLRRSTPVHSLHIEPGILQTISWVMKTRCKEIYTRINELHFDLDWDFVKKNPDTRKNIGIKEWRRPTLPFSQYHRR